MKPTLELLKELIACAPVSADIPAVNRAADLLHNYLAENGMFCQVEEIDGRHVLYAASTATRTPDILLNAHIDVVPGTPSQFQPFEKDGFLHGRGSNDCLGCVLVATQALLRRNGRKSVGIIFSADEEIGGKTTAEMVARGYHGRELILILDGDSYAIAVAQKGVLTLKLTATGVAAHASTPWVGRNAIDVLIEGYQKIRGLFPEAHAGDEWHNTLAATIIEGGTVANRIPDLASLTINIRYTETGSADSIAAEIGRLTGLTVKREGDCLPVVFDETMPVFTDLREMMRRNLGREISLVRMNGATDARHFVSVGVPIAIIGIPGRDVHGADEAVEIAGVRAYEEMLVDFLSV